MQNFDVTWATWLCHVASNLQISPLIALLKDVVGEAHRELSETCAAVVYQNLVDRIRADEQLLWNLYLTSTVKFKSSFELSIRQVLDGAIKVISLLLTRIEFLASLSQQQTRLPKLKKLPLSVFSGEISEYATFKELFDVHVNRCPDLGALEKQPLRVVQALSVTAAKYDVASGLLDC